jgi:hypothetical protein
LAIDTAYSAVFHGARQPLAEDAMLGKQDGQATISTAVEGVLAAAFVTTLAFRMRDETALVDGLRALTSAVEAYRKAADAEDDAAEEDADEALATE